MKIPISISYNKLELFFVRYQHMAKVRNDKSTLLKTSGEVHTKNKVFSVQTTVEGGTALTLNTPTATISFAIAFYLYFVDCNRQ